MSSKKKKSQEIVTKNRHQEQLWVALTEQEVRDRSKRISHELQSQLDDLRNKEATVKEQAKGIKSQIETIETEQSQLSREAREAKILRQVDCHEVWNYKDHTIKVIRLDTKETISDRKMKTEEASTLPMEDGTGGEAPGKPKDEADCPPPAEAAVAHSDPDHAEPK